MKYEFMTGAELASMLRTPEETLRFWRHVGKGPKSLKLGRRVVYRTADVEEWIDDQYATAEDNDAA